MILAVFALISWLTICAFSLIPKSLGLMDNIILFFLLSMCSTMSATILYTNLHLIETSQSISLFLPFVLLRSITYPLVLLGGINLVWGIRSVFGKMAVVSITLLMASGIEALARAAGLLTFTGWNLAYFLVLAFVLFALNLGFSFVLRKIT